MPESLELDVVGTRTRAHDYDYLVQLNERVIDRLGVADGDLLRVSNGGRGGPDGFDAAVLACVQRRDDLGDTEIGVDFTLRYALAVPSRGDANHGTAERGGRVTVRAADPPAKSLRHHLLDWLLGTRTEVCRVRMAIHPDLENRICRVSKNTLELLGVVEGDRIVIESADDRVTGVKTFLIDDDTRERKEQQQAEDADRYVDAYDRLDLNRIRTTGIDIPEIYVDAEIREELGLYDRPWEGACQPVRVYRDSRGQVSKHLGEFAVPLVIVFVGAALELGGAMLKAGLFASALVAAGFAVVFQSRKLLR